MLPQRALDPPGYRRRRPEETPVWRAVLAGLRTFVERCESDGTMLPRFVRRELDGYLRCGLLAYGFARVRCPFCKDDLLVALSCKGRGFCPSCSGRRMADTALRLVDSVLPDVPVRQWVLSVPFAVRLWLACDPSLLTAVLTIFVEEVTNKYRELARDRGLRSVRCGAVTSIQRFGSSLNLNVHFHTLFLDGAYVLDASGDPPRWQTLHPCDEDVREVVEAVRRRADALLSRRRQPPLLDEDRNLARVCQLSLLDERIDGPPSPRPRPARNGNPLPRKHMGARAGQWDLHAAVTVAQGKRDELLRLCKYIVRSPLALQRMELLPDGRIRYALRRPRLDGGTCIELEPVDLVARLTAMIPPASRPDAVDVEHPAEAFRHQPWSAADVSSDLRLLWLVDQVRQRRLGYAKAAELAHMPQAAFVQVLGTHRI